MEALDLNNPDTRFLEYARLGDVGGVLVTCGVFHANPFAIGPNGDAFQLASTIEDAVNRADVMSLIQDFRNMYGAPQPTTLQ
ncbi:hypothetical protein [Burkholderia anthina]|uniref:hypothetical protein n=1 Tax=Burkholderia anthina TaxID=179879 RepID=UPI0037C001FD